MRKTVVQLGVSAFLAVLIGGLALGAGLAFVAYRDARRADVLASSFRQIESAARRVEARVGAMEAALVAALTPSRGGGVGDDGACRRLANRFPAPLQLAGNPSAAESEAAFKKQINIPGTDAAIDRRVDVSGGGLALLLGYGDRPASRHVGAAGVPCEEGLASSGIEGPIRWLDARLAVDKVLEEMTRGASETSLFDGYVLVGMDGTRVIWQSGEPLPAGLRSLRDLVLGAGAVGRSAQAGAGSSDGVVDAFARAARDLATGAGFSPDLAPVASRGATPAPSVDHDADAMLGAAIRAWRPVQTDVRGAKFQVLCQPGVLGDLRADLALCGFLADARLDREIGVLRSEWLAPALTILALLLAAFPLLKVWTIGEWERLASRDIRLLVGAAFVAVGLGAYVLAEGGDRRAFRKEIDGQLEELARANGAALVDEVHAAVRDLDANRAALSLSPPRYVVEISQGKVPLDIVDLVWVDAQGSLVRNYEAERGDITAGTARSPQVSLALVPSPGISVRDRRYFTDAKAGAWRRLATDREPDLRFNLQIAASKTTGKPLLLVLRRVAGGAGAAAPPAGDLALLTINPRSFTGARPRSPFGFALVTPRGDVLLHSDPTRNESEKLVAESGDSETLDAALRAQQPEFLTVSYGARATRMRLEPLPDLDLTLITFVDDGMANAISWEVFARWSLLAGPYFLAGVFLLGSFWAFAPHYRAPWLWPDRQAVQARELFSLAILVVLSAAIGAAAVDTLEAQQALMIRSGRAGTFPLPSLGVLFFTPVAVLGGVALRVSLRRPLRAADWQGAVVICAVLWVGAAVLLVERVGIQSQTRPELQVPLGLSPDAGSGASRAWVLAFGGMTLLWSASAPIVQRLLDYAIRRSGTGRDARDDVGAPEGSSGAPGGGEPVRAVSGEARLAVNALMSSGVLFLAVGWVYWAGAARTQLAMSAIMLIGLGLVVAAAAGVASKSGPGGFRLWSRVETRLGKEAVFRWAYAIFLTALLFLVSAAPSFVLHRNVRSQLETELAYLKRMELARDAAAVEPAASGGAFRQGERLWSSSWVAPPLVRLAEANLRGVEPSSAGSPGFADAPRPLAAHMAGLLVETGDRLTARMRATAPLATLTARSLEGHDGSPTEEWRTTMARLEVADRLASRETLVRRGTQGRDPFVVVVWLGGLGLVALVAGLVRGLSVKLFALDADGSGSGDRVTPEVLGYAWPPTSRDAARPGAGAGAETAAEVALTAKSTLDLGCAGDVESLAGLLASIGGLDDDVAVLRLESILHDDAMRRSVLTALRLRVAQGRTGRLILTSVADPVRFLEELYRERAATVAHAARSAGHGPGDELSPSDEPANSKGVAPGPVLGSAAGVDMEALAKEIRQWRDFLATAESRIIDLAAFMPKGSGAPTAEKAPSPAGKPKDVPGELARRYAADAALLANAPGSALRVLRSRAARLWESLDQKEKLTMIQLQQEGFVNPARIGALRRLIERGLVVRDPTLRVRSEWLGEFVATCETRATIRRWETPIERSAWGQIQRPLGFAAGGVALLVLALQGGSASQAAVWLGSLGSLGTAVPTLLRLMGFAESPGSKPTTGRP